MKGKFMFFATIASLTWLICRGRSTAKSWRL